MVVDNNNDMHKKHHFFARDKSDNILKEDLMKLITMKRECTSLDIFKEFECI